MKQAKSHAMRNVMLISGAAVALYLFGTKKGAQKRKAIGNWMMNAKEDVAAKVKKLKNVAKDDYEKIVGGVIEKYEKLDVDKQELKALGAQLKSTWNTIAKNHGLKKKAVVKAAKKAVRKIKRKVK